MTNDGNRPHALYRFWNADEVLLYIGLTADPGTRWKAHSKDKPWWHEVANVTLEKFDSREEVAVAEIAAIKTEKPLYNVQHSSVSGPRDVELIAPELLAFSDAQAKLIGGVGLGVISRIGDWSEQAYALREERLAIQRYQDQIRAAAARHALQRVSAQGRGAKSRIAEEIGVNRPVVDAWIKQAEAEAEEAAI